MLLSGFNVVFSQLLITEDFGSGISTWGPANPCIVGLTYDPTPFNPPQDSEYRIGKGNQPFSVWYGYSSTGSDHTDNTNGYNLVANVFNVNEVIYERVLKGISLSSIDFSLWAYNSHATWHSGQIIPEIRLVLRDVSTNAIISQSSVITIPQNETWNYYSLVAPLNGNSAVRAQIVNVALGGTGNDYLIDDITISAVSILPVELSFFNAQEKDQQVALEWETSSEHNNDYFIVEKSNDLKTWDFVGQINGVGNSTQLNSYRLVDLAPFYGTSYYRLNQVDFDGQTTLSNVQSVYVPNDLELVAFPNPATSQISIKSRTFDHQNFRMFSMDCRDVTSLVIPISMVKNAECVLDVSQLSEGSYFLRSGDQFTKVIIER